MLRVSDDQIASMIDVDHKQTEDFLAFVDDGALVGSAMIAIEPAGERAEVAIAVRADYKHPGVGWTLLNRAADYDKKRGCCPLAAVASRLNQKATAVERDAGLTGEARTGARWEGEEGV